MIQRRVNGLLGIIGLISLASFPWWFTLITLIANIVLAKPGRESEICFVFSISIALFADLIYRVAGSGWFGFRFWFTGIIVVVIIVRQLIDRFINFNP